MGVCVFGNGTSVEAEKIQNALLGYQEIQADVVHAAHSQLPRVKKTDSKVRSNTEKSE
jgi:hypothetical protein